MLQLSVWKEVGGFEEKLFIDEVDHEYCYRCYLKGYKIMHFDNIRLNHALGTKIQAGYLGVIAKGLRTVHSPARTYFIVRNYLYVRKKYKRFMPGVFKKRDAEMLVIIKNELLFSGFFKSNLINMYRAYRDYLKGDFSAKI